jgi:hypothetical protein
MRSTSHRIATSGSVTPKTAATYWIGAASRAVLAVLSAAAIVFAFGVIVF